MMPSAGRLLVQWFPDYNLTGFATSVVSCKKINTKPTLNNAVVPRELPRTFKLLTGICISICKDVTEPSKDSHSHFYNLHLFVFSKDNWKEPAWLLNYCLLILQHLHTKFSPMSVASIRVQSHLYLHSLIHNMAFKDTEIRVMEATNKITNKSIW